MYKYLLALVVLTGSFASYADMYSDESPAVDNANRSSAGDKSYEDTSSMSSSATSRSEQSNMDSTVTGTMPDMSKEGLTAQKWHAGITSGISASHRQEISNSPSFGFDVGYQPVEHFGAGFEGITARQDDANRYQRTTGLLKGTYVVGGDIPVLRTSYLGAGIGPVFISNKVRWAGAPMVGFDVPLSSSPSKYLSLGLNAKYIFTTNNADTPKEFASAFAVKYWF